MKKPYFTIENVTGKPYFKVEDEAPRRGDPFFETTTVGQTTE